MNLSDSRFPPSNLPGTESYPINSDSLKQEILHHLFYTQGKLLAQATAQDIYQAVAHTLRDHLLSTWLKTQQIYQDPGTKIVCYLSPEFLPGRHLTNHLLCLKLQTTLETALTDLGYTLDALIEQEQEPSLGNSGLGRLASCFMDSLSTHQIPARGYGIRYQFGIFNQEIQDGWQVETTDPGLREGNPWEMVRLEDAVEVKFGGHTESYTDETGRYRVRWQPNRLVKGIPYDTPIPGYPGIMVNSLRLWKAGACESFDFPCFNMGDYYSAIEEKITSENITKVLYPRDEPFQGKRLHLEQQYFFVSCCLQDLIRLHLSGGNSIQTLPEKFAIHLNDTYPALAVAELIRLLVDEYQLGWDEAWQLTQQTFSYTNHTLLPETLEKWPISLFGSLLPRHLEVIFEINYRFLQIVRNKYGEDVAKLARLSMIDENGERYIRMINLACVGSHSINGVASLHTKLLMQDSLHDFYDLWPGKFSSKTNGVSPRRWLVLSNPRLTELITDTIGDRWITELDYLHKLEEFAEDTNFQQRWRQVKQFVKQELTDWVAAKVGIKINRDSIFDIQAKRFHEYKRQHLNVFHIITLYHQIKENPDQDITPRTFIFAGKAAPSYFMAKLMIKLINSVAEVVNNDPDVNGRIQVIFLPNYNVTNSQRIYPAADLSEQISMAGKEASGIGNMKFAMNGALTIGTLDGANIEIRDQVGAGNFFLFGLPTEEVFRLKANGYNPWDYYHSNSSLKAVIDLISAGHFSQGNTNLFKPLLNSLLYRDEYMLFADYQSYIDCQQQVSQYYQDPEKWTQMSILNVARLGKFSSDRAIQEYCQEIWHVKPV